MFLSPQILYSYPSYSLSTENEKTGAIRQEVHWPVDTERTNLHTTPLILFSLSLSQQKSHLSYYVRPIPSFAWVWIWKCSFSTGPSLLTLKYAQVFSPSHNSYYTLIALYLLSKPSFSTLLYIQPFLCSSLLLISECTSICFLLTLHPIHLYWGHLRSQAADFPPVSLASLLLPCSVFFSTYHSLCLQACPGPSLFSSVGQEILPSLSFNHQKQTWFIISGVI